jgi:hypothetical protein
MLVKNIALKNYVIEPMDIFIKEISLLENVIVFVVKMNKYKSL